MILINVKLPMVSARSVLSGNSYFMADEKHSLEIENQEKETIGIKYMYL